MGIASLAVGCGDALNVCFASDRGLLELVSRLQLAKPASLPEIERQDAIQGGARAGLITAMRERARQKRSLAIMPRADLDHDVSILITVEDVAGR
jgi:hypothetical protein